jgi:hypothetical protein
MLKTITSLKIDYKDILKTLDNKNISVLIPITLLNEYIGNNNQYISIPYKEISLNKSGLKRTIINKYYPIYRLNNSRIEYKRNITKKLDNFSILKKLIKKYIKDYGSIGYKENKLYFKFFKGNNISVFEVLI